MTDYSYLKAATAVDDAGIWESTPVADRHILAYGPVMFHGSVLFQEVIWRGPPPFGFLRSSVRVEDLYETHG